MLDKPHQTSILWCVDLFPNSDFVNSGRCLVTSTTIDERCFYVICAAIVAMQRRGKHVATTIEWLCFLRGLCRGVFLKTVVATVSCGIFAGQ
jgi:hypothetical protein